MPDVKDFKEHDRICQNLLIKSSVKGVTTKGSPYLILQLQDTGCLQCKRIQQPKTFWDNRISVCLNAQLRHLVPVKILCHKFFTDILYTFCPIVRNLQRLSCNQNIVGIVGADNFITIHIHRKLPHFFSVTICTKPPE